MPKESAKPTISAFTGVGWVRVIDDANGTPVSRNMPVDDLATEIGAGGGSGGAPTLSSGTGAPSSTPGKLGDLYVDDDGLELYVAVGTSSSGDWDLVASNTSHAHIEAGAGAPSSTPTKVGDIYIDTSNDVAYMATGTASSADWTSTAPGTVTVPFYETVTLPDSFTSTAGAEGIASAWKCPVDGAELLGTDIWVDTAPTNAVILVDLHKNGTTVFTGGTARPSIATSTTAADSGAPSITSMAADDLFQFQVDSLHASDQGNVGRLFCRIRWQLAVNL